LFISIRGGAKRRKQEGGIFENGRRGGTLYFHPKSKKNLHISSPKIGENCVQILQSRRKIPSPR
jgi:hypothetical protein